MQDRSLSGTTEWNRCSVVLDVAEDATAIGPGMLLSGLGEARVADLRFETVSTEVPTTGHGGARERPSPPESRLLRSKTSGGDRHAVGEHRRLVGAGPAHVGWVATFVG